MNRKYEFGGYVYIFGEEEMGMRGQQKGGNLSE